jgi:hypothetical protein
MALSGPLRLHSKIGNPVSGEDFFPRPDVVDRLHDDLAMNRGSRRLFALRRIGKTSVLVELERRLRASKGLTVIRVDVQGLYRFQDFLGKVFEQIPTENRFQKIRARLNGNAALQALMPWVLPHAPKQVTAPAKQDFVSEFQHSAIWAGDIAAALKEAGPIALLIDELPFMMRIMINRGYKPADVEAFLATLRDWRMNSDVRMLFSGSIGLAQLKRVEKIHVDDHIADVLPVTLPPLPHDPAIEMIEALSRGEAATGWTPALSEAIVNASAETWPIFLQYGFDAVRRDGTRDPTSVSAIIEREVRPVLDATFYKQFDTRLARYGQDEGAARAILRAVIGAGEQPATFTAIDAALKKVSQTALKKRDDLLEALSEDNFMYFDTAAQTARPASRLVPIWVRAKAWGRSA